MKIRTALSARSLLATLACLFLMMSGPIWSAENYALVLAGGRVIDPETGLDAIRHVGINDGKIRAVSEQPLRGEETIDVQGLVWIEIVDRPCGHRFALALDHGRWH